jgi:putative lipoic acid-binding regulatory protein
MTTPTDPKEFWAKFKTDLDFNFAFPTEYFYKFILPTDVIKINTLKGIFMDTKAQFTYRESSGGKYTSITISFIHQSSDEVIRFYEQAVLIEGIKSL